MENFRDSSMVGGDLPPSSTHQYLLQEGTSAEALDLNSGLLVPPVSGTEENALAGSLNQLFQVPMSLGPTDSFLEDPSSLIGSSVGVDSSLLATLDYSTSLDASLHATLPVKPAVDETGLAEGILITDAPNPSTETFGGVGGADVSVGNTEQSFRESPQISTDRGSGGMTELDIGQLASSIIDSASVAGPDSSFLTGSRGLLGIEVLSGAPGNLMDQISPPLELPDLNLVMAEGMAAQIMGPKKEGVVTEGGGFFYLGGGLATQQPVSITPTPAVSMSVSTGDTLSLEQAADCGVQDNLTAMASDQTQPDTANTAPVKSATTTTAIPSVQAIATSSSTLNFDFSVNVKSMTRTAGESTSTVLPVSQPKPPSLSTSQPQPPTITAIETLSSSSSNFTSAPPPSVSMVNSLSCVPAASVTTSSAPATATLSLTTQGAAVCPPSSTPAVSVLTAFVSTPAPAAIPAASAASLTMAPAVAPPLPTSSTAVSRSSTPSTASIASFPPPSAVTLLTPSTSTATTTPIPSSSTITTRPTPSSTVPLLSPLSTSSAAPSSSGPSSSLSTFSTAPSSSSASSPQPLNPAAAMLAKGLNLPLLQFLHLNFPSLKIKDLQDVLSVNTLLAQVLKQQINQEAGTQQPLSAKTDQPTTASPARVPQPSLKPGAANTLSATTLQPNKTVTVVPSGTATPSTGNAPSATARSATQTGLFVPSAPLRTVSALAKQQQSVSSQTTTSSSATPLSLFSSFSEVKAMPARPVRADGQPVLPHTPAGTSVGVGVSSLAKQSPTLLSTLSAPAKTPAAAVSQGASSRKPVFVQILNKTSATASPSSATLSASPRLTASTSTRTPVMVPRTTPLSKSPLILNRHGRVTQQDHVVHTTLASVPRRALGGQTTATASSTAKPSTPVTSLCVSLSLPALRKSQQQEGRKKRKTPVRKSALLSSNRLDLGLQLSRTVVQPAESEAMEVDVGQPIQRLELPKHLKDHSYSVYNPEEGEKQQESVDMNLHSASSIPPARLSYAPQVPDSPTTLHKLLKVLPKKNSRQSLATSPPPRSPSGRSSFGRGARTRGVRRTVGRGGKGRGKSAVKKVGSSPTPRAESGEESRASSTDQSDAEETSRKNRRRSQRHTGQRKRYIDDLNIPISDDELLEDVMSTRPPRKKDYKGYGNQDESDFEGWGTGGVGEVAAKDKLSSKHKSRTISINPTEGFQYSDVYFEPPAEEANVVEKILSHRVRGVREVTDEGENQESMEEFLVKYKNYSYLHAEWVTFDKLLQGDPRFDGKVKRYKAKQASLGIFSNVDDEPFNPEYTVVDRALDVATQAEANGEVVTHYLVKWKSLPYEDATWELEEDVDIDSIAVFNKRQIPPSDKERSFVPRPPPANFKPLKEIREYKDGNLLRSYQREGLNWLVFNWYARQNCILADEMGLGKTVQSIAFLMELFNAGIRGPFLVIVPLSTIGNWQREFETWCDFNVIIYHGSAYSRRLIHEYDLFFRDSRGKIISEAYKFNVIVTTYEVMLSDDSELQNIDWRAVVIDEAHRLKNRNCKLLEGLKRLSMEHRVLLTGTPLQNSVEELFSLLNFLEPHTFPSHISFLQQFGDLKTEEQVEELKTILKPMMLRRLKEDVEKSIASKEETIIEVELTAIQKQYYRAILERNFMFLSKGSTAPTTAIPSLLNVMMELRKCCNHPFLIKGAEQKIVTDWQTQRPTETIQNSLIQASGKLVLIDKLLPKLKESGHKVLIFSQMVRCLDIMEDYLRMKGYFYERIDGQVRGTLRQAAIDRFSKPDSDRFVFLLCTRAGGLGINLTAADTVIIYDSDWNPQNDIQAQARCHRIGQNKPVKVYRLITRNSYEREMFDRASLKLGLDKAVLHSVTTSQQAAGPPQLSKKEIEELLKKGAYGALMEGDDDDANRFCEEDIDQILEQRAHVVQLENEGKGSTFSKASFVSDESSDINIDDPDFWQKWAEKAKLDLDELVNKDNLVLDTPRQRRQVRRYGNDHLEGEIVDMIDPKEDVIPSRGRHGWTKIELFKTEKWVLIYGWGQWKDILSACDFRKRQLGVGDVENISRTILIYCLAHFKGDEKIPPYIHRLIDPSEVTETGEEAESRFSQFTEDDYLALLSKNSETLFQDESYMKHLRRHAHKIIFRIRQLHIIRWQMLVDHKKQIMKGVSAKSLGLLLPKPEDKPPILWWNMDCDHSLVVGILKHGYEQFHLFRADPALCFRAMVGEEPPGSRKKKKSKPSSAKGKGEEGEEDGEEEEEEEEEDLDLSGEESDEESAPSTPGLGVRLSHRKTRSIATNTPGRVAAKPGMYVWPTLADVNTRARRLVSAWVKHEKKEEQKQVLLIKEKVKREKEAEVSRKKEQKKAELAQKWSKREEQDFARVISFFGIIFDAKANKYNWMKFRQLASLSKKSDERLTLYLHDFQQMCRRVILRKSIRRGLSGIRVEPITEERAIRCLQRIELLSAVRLEILPHPDFDSLIELCEQSFEVPSWWIPANHDRDLLRGVSKHGLYRSDQLIYNDVDLSFKKTVPQTALFDPTTNQVAFPEEDESGSDDEEGPKLRSSIPSGSNPVPLGWPKEKAIAIRITRIVYAFRNCVWPKPMEGLDLFNPTISEESSDDSSLSDMDTEGGRSDSDFEVVTTRSKRKAGLTLHISTHAGKGKLGAGAAAANEKMVDVVGDGDQKRRDQKRRDFEIEKQQGLKMTFKKSFHTPIPPKSKAIPAKKTSTPARKMSTPAKKTSTPARKTSTPARKMSTPAKKSSTPAKKPEVVTKLEIKIPLVKLSFASKTGLKRIPKKRPAERGTTLGSDPPDSKKQKTQSSSSSGIDPTKINFTDLTGHERVCVINRNTNERLPFKQSPMLKNLKLWLEGHPHFNVDPKWGSLAIEWGALKPDMYHRVLLGNSSEHSSSM